MPEILDRINEQFKMKIYNDEHVTLHKEAVQVLEQAGRGGWPCASIIIDTGYSGAYRWPIISLFTGEQRVNISTIPGYIKQTIFYEDGDGSKYVTVKYNQPILTPRLAEMIVSLVRLNLVVV